MPRERHAHPAAGDECHARGARNRAAERQHAKEIAVEQAHEITHARIDGEPPDPGQLPRPRADSVKRDIARHHAGVDAQRRRRDRDHIVHDDIGAEDDREIGVHKRQAHQKERCQPRHIVA